jgi:hypothetical protein
MSLGIIACTSLKPELEKLLALIREDVKTVYLDAAQHIRPQKMRKLIREEIIRIGPTVDAVFLGYGFCQSLQGIEKEFDFPVILPQVDDCIALLLTPERYAEEIRHEVGTWFMSPGWADVGTKKIIRGLKLDRSSQRGKDPMEMARRLFSDYRRVLFIDTGVGEREIHITKARNFCRDFNLTLEITRGETTLLETWLNKARAAAEHIKKRKLGDSIVQVE